MCKKLSVFLLILIIAAVLPNESYSKITKKERKDYSLEIFSGMNTLTSELNKFYDPGYGLGIKFEKRWSSKLAIYGILSYNSFPDYEENNKILNEYYTSHMRDISLYAGLSYYFLTKDLSHKIAPFIGLKAGYIVLNETVSYKSEEENIKDDNVYSIQGISPVAGCSFPLNESFVLTGTFSYLISFVNVSDYDNLNHENTSYSVKMPYDYYSINLGVSYLF